MLNVKTKPWIEKAKKTHGDLYNYSKSVFVKSTEKLIITCYEHGDFLQNPGNHLNGSGCPKCGKKLNSQNRTKSNDYFISEAKKVHGDLYDYSKSVYISSNEKLIITCKKHGDFEQIAGNHLIGRGCHECAFESRRSNNVEFINKAINIHGDIYLYNKVEYVGAENKVIITCKKHGDFEQIPQSHLNGSGCQKCANEKASERQLLSFDDFKEKAKNIHGDLYEYVNYNGYQYLLDIICKKHGKFQQLALNHLKGNGCNKCGQENSIKSRTKLIDEFIIEAKNVHGDKYNYDNTKYNGSREKLNIYCNNKYSDGIKHGEFYQTAMSHLSGRGCPKCANLISKPELEIIELIKSLGINNIITKDRQILNGKELDIYLPDYNIAIEYNGLYWHSDEYRTDNYHLQKTNDCLSKGIQLIQIFEDEWINTPDIIKSRLRNILGKTPNIIYARKTEIFKISTEITKQFLIDNHIQGNTNSYINYGLAILNEQSGKYQLVSVMTFGKPRVNLGNKQSGENDYELVRFCNKLDTTIIGGASKLLKYFISKYKPENIISYADKRWSLGNLYEKLGFTLSHESKPNYFYVQGLKRINRFKYRKDILVSKYGCSNTDTERNFTKNTLGLNRIYDCGTKVYKLIIP